MKNIEVPGHGIVEFPDDMTDEQIVAAIQKNTAAQASPQQGQPILNPLGEAVAALGTGAVAAPASGLVGLTGAVLPGPQGQGADWARQIQELAYQPRSQQGQQALAAASYLPQKVEQGIDWLGGKITDVTGSPALGTATRVAPDAAMLLLGKRLLARRAPVAQTPAAEAFSSGYNLTPSQANANIALKALEGLSGSAKLEKMISIKNAERTKQLVREDFNLPENKAITPETLDEIIAQNGEAYEAVKSSVKLIKPDAKFKADAQRLRGDLTKAATEYPDLLKNESVETLINAITVPASPRAMVELTKKLRNDASVNLKSFDDPAKRELGFAQRNAALAVENMIDRALLSVGKGDLVKNWRDARVTIAKAYDVKSALNESTGEISAIQLGRLYKKGAPLTGGMEKAAKFARSFEKSAREVGKMSDVTEFGYGDLLAGMLGSGMGGVIGGPFGMLAGPVALGARPAIRHMLIQRAAPTPKLPLLGGGLATIPLLGQQRYPQH